MANRKANKTSRKTPSERTTQAKRIHDHIVGRICRLGDAMVRMSSRDFGRLWNLRHTDVRLLNILDSEEPVPVTEISRRAMVDQAWVSRSLRALEAGKFVQRCRDAKDSRLVLFTVTKRGRQVLDEFRPYAAWSEKVLLKGVDEEKLKALLDQVEGNTQGLIDTLEYMPQPGSRDGG